MKNNGSPLTIRELAKLAGCSRTTASLALRDDPSLRPKTKDRIKELAEKHGYRRNTVVSSLMTQLRFYKKGRSREKLAVLTWGDRL